MQRRSTAGALALALASSLLLGGVTSAAEGEVGGLAGRVVNGSGQALAGAEVTAVTDGAQAPVAQQLTDSDGGFHFDSLPAGYWYRLRSAGPGRLRGRIVPSLWVAPGTVDDGLVITARPAPMLRLNVHDDTGAALPGRCVSLSERPHTFTDALGMAEFDLLDPGWVFVQVLSPECGSGTPEWDRSVLVRRTGVTDVDVLLRRGGTVVGHVRDDQGHPVARVCIFLGRQRTVTAADGSYRFEQVPPGSYVVAYAVFHEQIQWVDEIRCRGDKVETYSGGTEVAAAARPLVVRPNVTSVADAVVRRRGGIRGHVTVSRNTPAGACVSLTDRAGHELDTSVVDYGGRFVFGPGQNPGFDFRLRLARCYSTGVVPQFWDGVRDAAEAKRMELSDSGEASITTNGDARGRLRVRAVDTEGNPVSARFRVDGVIEGVGSNVDLSLPAGRHVLGTLANLDNCRDYYPHFYCPATRAPVVVDVPPFGIRDLGQVELGPTGRVAGRVTGTAGQALLQLSPVGEPHHLPYYYGYTRDGGLFDMWGVAPGEWDLTVLPNDAAPVRQRVVVASDTTTSIDPAVPSGGTVRFRLTWCDPSPADCRRARPVQADVALFDEFGGARWYAPDPGVMTFEHVPAGPFEVVAYINGTEPVRVRGVAVDGGELELAATADELSTAPGPLITAPRTVDVTPGVPAEVSVSAVDISGVPWRSLRWRFAPDVGQRVDGMPAPSEPDPEFGPPTSRALDLDASGHGTVTLSATGNGTLFLLSPHGVKFVRVTVRPPRMRAALDRTEMPLGEAAVVAAQIAPLAVGQRASLQRYTDVGWRSVSRLPVDVHSVVRFEISPSRRGRFAYRVVLPSTLAHPEATSPVVRIAVT